MQFSRRQLFAAAGAVSAPLLLASCGFAPQSTKPKAGSDTLTFTTWGTDAELAGLRAAIAGFEKANSGTTVELNAVPYAQMFQNIDAQIQAGNPPDIFRVPYYTFGAYAGRGQLLDLSKHLDSDFSQRFTPQAWAAVQRNGKPFGVPHHTDTSLIVYNKAALASAGITGIPTTADDAWTWTQFTQVLTTLRSKLPDDKYPLAVNWQGNGVTRWLNWLFESDGRFLATDLLTPAIASDAGRQTVDYTASFFAKRFVPQNNSVKSATLAQDTWFSQTSAMAFAGAFLIPDATSTLTFDWGATPAPRNVRGGSDFGGNALVATAGADPELAAKFLDYVTREEPMRTFCEGASLLPTRADLVQGGISFKTRPELSKTWVSQAAVVKAQDASQVASPSMSGIITVLQNQLDAAFVGGQNTATTLSNMTDGISQATHR